MRDVTGIVLAGVGGHGTILVSSILSEGLVRSGYDVKMSEIHGMAQRGGSVSTQVRYGRKVYSPVMGPGEADILVAFETMEALRGVEYVRPGGKVIVNDQKIPSAPILMGRRTYPEGVIETLKAKVDTIVIDGLQLATGLGNPRVANIVLLGALVEVARLHETDWEAVVASIVKPAFLELNLVAFRAGRGAVAAPLREDRS